MDQIVLQIPQDIWTAIGILLDFETVFELAQTCLSVRVALYKFLFPNIHITPDSFDGHPKDAMKSLLGRLDILIYVKHISFDVIGVPGKHEIYGEHTGFANSFKFLVESSEHPHCLRGTDLTDLTVSYLTTSHQILNLLVPISSLRRLTFCNVSVLGHPIKGSQVSTTIEELNFVDLDENGELNASIIRLLFGSSLQILRISKPQRWDTRRFKGQKIKGCKQLLKDYGLTDDPSLTHPCLKCVEINTPPLNRPFPPAIDPSRAMGSLLDIAPSKKFTW